MAHELGYAYTVDVSGTYNAKRGGYRQATILENMVAREIGPYAPMRDQPGSGHNTTPRR